MTDYPDELSPMFTDEHAHLAEFNAWLDEMARRADDRREQADRLRDIHHAHPEQP